MTNTMAVRGPYDDYDRPEEHEPGTLVSCWFDDQHKEVHFKLITSHDVRGMCSYVMFRTHYEYMICKVCVNPRSSFSFPNAEILART